EKRARFKLQALGANARVVCYLRRGAATLPAGGGSLISCPACSSALGAMPLSRATSSAETFRAAAIFAMVSPLRARTFVRLEEFPASAAVVERRQFVNRTLLFGTTSLLADFKSTPGFIVCRVATLTPVRFAIPCHS